MNNNFKIILIGGGSGSGKSTLAGELARHYGINHVLVDDIRIAMQSTQDKDSTINFFFQESTFDRYSSNELSQYHKRVSIEVCKGLRDIADHHVSISEPMILEGDDVLPEFAYEMMQKYGDCISSIFICEVDYNNILENSLKRGRNIGLKNIDERSFKLALEDNLSIKSSAEKLGLEVLDPRPYETLLDKALEKI